MLYLPKYSSPMYKTSLVTSCLFAGTAVVLGALGAHALKPILGPELIQSFETGVRYQFYHAVALFLVGLYAAQFKTNIRVIYGLFTAGTILFSGSIYALCLLKSEGHIGLGGLGILTPIGGVLFIGGWLLWLLQLIKLPKHV